MGYTFHWVCGMESSRVVGNRASNMISEVELKCNLQMLFNKGVVIVASKPVDISHHSCWPMKDLKEVAK